MITASNLHRSYSIGKKSIEIKLSDPDAQKLLLDVVKDYDVLISSTGPAGPERPR